MTDPRLKMISYRAWRRGFREADLILGPFADAWLSRLSAAQLDAFERLLDQPDQDLYAWIIGQSPAPTAFEGPVLDLIRAFQLPPAGAGRAEPGV
jgi:antitoxin CptB